MSQFSILLISAFIVLLVVVVVVVVVVNMLVCCDGVNDDGVLIFAYLPTTSRIEVCIRCTGKWNELTHSFTGDGVIPVKWFNRVEVIVKAEMVSLSSFTFYYFLLILSETLHVDLCIMSSLFTLLSEMSVFPLLSLSCVINYAVCDLRRATINFCDFYKFTYFCKVY